MSELERRLFILSGFLIEFNEKLKEATQAIDALIPQFEALHELLKKEREANNGDS